MVTDISTYFFFGAWDRRLSEGVSREIVLVGWSHGMVRPVSRKHLGAAGGREGRAGMNGICVLMAFMKTACGCMIVSRNNLLILSAVE